MIHLVSSQPVHWPIAQTPSVAQVTPVSAVTATQRTKGEGQPGSGSDRDPRLAAATQQRTAEDKAATSSGAAPLLPRAAPDGDRSAASAKDNEAKQEQVRNEKQTEEEASAKALNLMEVLSTVWKASAAVVEDALGIGAAASKGGLEKAETKRLTDAKKASEEAMDLEKKSNEALKPVEGPLLGRAAGDPVAYTEQGTSEWMAVETGQLVRKSA
jgi:hypothetical protein